jgi:hypothetical protein
VKTIKKRIKLCPSITNPMLKNLENIKKQLKLYYGKKVNFREKYTIKEIKV